MIWIIYHTDSDGYAAGYAVYRHLKRTDPLSAPAISWWSMGYGSKLPEIDYENDSAFMVDFSLPAEKMVDFASKLGSRLCWCDHHDTSVQMEEKFPMLKKIPGRRLVELDGVPISGCELTWRYLMPNSTVPNILRIVGDWDTWRWKKMGSEDQYNAKAFQHYLRAYDFDPRSHEGRQMWASMGDVRALQKALQEGRTLIKYQANEWEKTVRWLSFEAEFAGHPAILINRSGGSEMFKASYDPSKHDIMVAFSLVKGKYLTVSMYSDKEHIHLGELAQELAVEGGGGHRGAAGFQCSWEHLWSLIKMPS